MHSRLVHRFRIMETSVEAPERCGI